MKSRLSPSCWSRMRRARLPAFALPLALVFLLPCAASAEWIDLGGDPVSVNLIESDGGRSVFEITIGGFDAEPVIIDGSTYYRISLAREGISQDLGFPALPNVRRSLIIPDDQEMTVTLLSSAHVDYSDLPVAPSKGNLLRSVDPKSVPYTLDPFYKGNGVYPAEPLEADEPYILRDFRGMVVDANVFQYLPATQTLRIYTSMRIEVAPVGPGRTNVLQRAGLPAKMDRQFVKLYLDHFLNYGGGRYTPVQEDGGLLIITYDAFAGSIQPLADWKLQKGIPTKVATLSETGASYTQIKTYIQTEYALWAPAYVLLVGDGPQVPVHGSDSDPGYSTILGGDNYPDLFIGRFSAENSIQVNTQVARTITYERDQQAAAVWPQYGTGVASNQGPGHYGEYDNEHLDLIRDDLLAYGYLGVDQIYDPSGIIADVSAALNAGRGIVNYTGHGSVTAWSSTGFSNTNVNALVNDDLLPFICSVACNNGTFTSTTCFAEAWLRASNGANPTGAIACYMSLISQSWDPPMYAQDEAVDLLVADQMRTAGGLWFNGSCHMMDMTGSTGENEFLNWTIFGDPSVAVRTKAAASLAVSHSGVLLIGQSDYAVTVTGETGALCALYAGGVLYGSALTDGAGYALITLADPPTDPMTLKLTITAYNRVTNVDDVEVLPPSGPYLTHSADTVLDPTGDNDGVLDECEAAGLEVTLENVGVDEATGLSGTLSTTDSYVTVTVATQGFPDIPAAGFGTCGLPFEVEVAGDVPDGHLIQFTLDVTGNEGSWSTSFSLAVEAPVLAASGSFVNDVVGGNGSGTADAGETFLLDVYLANSGHSDADDLAGYLTCGDGNVVIHDPNGDCAQVLFGAAGTMATFEVEILPGYPEPANLAFQLEISSPLGYATTVDFEIAVGGWLDDMEADRAWIVGAPDDDASSGTWVRVDPVGTTYGGYVIQPEDDHTPSPGAQCYITGNTAVGGAAGDNDVDGGKTTLLTPVFDLAEATSATVSYWRWYSNSYGNYPDEDWWDVEITSNGTDWVSLEHTQTTTTAWVQQTFVLTDYITLTDQVQIRFIAADEGLGGSLVEAGVDDFLLNASYSILSGVDDDSERLPALLTLSKNFPNPFNPQTTIRFDLPRAGKVNLAVYDITGRLIATLISEEIEAGHHELNWQGRDQNGRQVASGIYFSRLEFGRKILTRKMTLLK